MMSHAFNKIVVGSVSFVLSMDSNRPMSVLSLMSLFFHNFSSAVLSFSSSKYRARIFSSKVFFYVGRHELSSHITNDVCPHLPPSSISQRSPIV